MKLRIIPADNEDIHKGWIRLSKNDRGCIPNTSYVRIKANGQTIYCQIRGTQRGDGVIEISEWYRSLLGWEDAPDNADFEIIQVGLTGRLRALSMHPDDTVRVSTGLGLFSVGLGLLSILFVTVTSSINLFGGEDAHWGFLGIGLSLLMSIFIGYIFQSGISIFTRTPKVVRNKTRGKNAQD